LPFRNCNRSDNDDPARALGKGLIRDNQLMGSYLALLEYLMNTQLFTLGGVVWGKVLVYRARKGVAWKDCFYLIVLYLLVMLIRFVQVGAVYPIFSRIGLRSDWKEAIFLSYAGLRGAVSVALALSLTRSVREVTENEDVLDATEALEFMSGGVTLLTLLLNGSMAGQVLKWLGLVRPVTSRKRALRLFRMSAKSFFKTEFRAYVHQKRFMRTNYNVVKLHVPFATDEPSRDSDDIATSSDIIATDCCRLVDPDKGSYADDVLMELRTIYSEELKKAFTSELIDCGLDEAEPALHDLDILLSNTGLSSTLCNEQRSPFWRQYCSFFDDASAFLSRVLQRGCAQNDGLSHNYEFQRFRNAVLRAMALIEAHSTAEKKLLSYAKASEWARNDNPWLKNAVDTVLREQSNSVQEVNATLSMLPTSRIDSIVSHYVCLLLLRKLAKFVETCVLDGQLTKKEAKEFLAKIDHSAYNTQGCPGCCFDIS